MILLDKVLLSAYPEVNPVRNFIGAFNPVGIILKCCAAAEQRGIISNGVKKSMFRQASEDGVNPVRNSIGAFNPVGIILKY